MKRSFCAAALTGVFIIFSGMIAASAQQVAPETHGKNLRMASPAFSPDADIPKRFTCSGADISPPLSWSNVSDNARSLALIVDDPDAPFGRFVHWVVFNLPQRTTNGELIEAMEGHIIEQAELTGRFSR